VSAFGPAAEVSRTGTVDPVSEIAWCNLCRAEGKVFVITADDEWTGVMQKHSDEVHPEHEAALRRGEPYVPVEVEA
jgi:hypothetical protein